MRTWDVLRFSSAALSGAKLRTSLMLLAMAIGVAAVVILTALGEGARRYVTDEFSSLGSNLLIMMPGRSETSGVNPSLLLGQTPRELTIDDALALKTGKGIKRVAPVALGVGSASWRSKEREVPVIGSTAAFLDIRQFRLAKGRFIPDMDWDRSMAVVVIGQKLKKELFGASAALGEWLRIGDRRFRVIGVLADTGRSLGMDLSDMAVVPVASAQMLYNTSNLPRIFIEANSRESMVLAKAEALRIIRDRHQGEEDVTIISQDSMLATFDNILRALTLTVAGIAAISLAVAGILVMNVMLVAVSQRTAEVGLLKALGATPRQIQTLFLTEASMLSFWGAFIGLVLGLLLSFIGQQFVSEISLVPPMWAVLVAMFVAFVTGLVFGVLPALRASKLDPVVALARGKT